MYNIWYEKEPKLKFGGNNLHSDPMAGLALYGPFKSDNARSLTMGIIGTRDSVSQSILFLKALMNEIPANEKEPNLFPKYPGLPKAFNTRLEIPESLIEIIGSDEVKNTIMPPNPYDRVIRAADVYLKRLESLRSSEPHPDVVICSIPVDFEDNCWSSGTDYKSKKEKKEIRARKKLSEGGQLFLEDFDEEIIPVIENIGASTDLHSRIKAGAMEKGVKTQLILESSMSGQKTTEPLCTFAWNLSLALFYKANGFPWKLSNTSENDCFVGISFYRERSDTEVSMGTTIAQLFDKTWEGLIIKAGKAEVSNGDRNEKSPHLSLDNSINLGKQILGVYEMRSMSPPERIVFHKTSKFWDSEVEGLRIGLGKNIKVDFVAIERGDLRLVRDGQYPPVRGTCLQLSPDDYLVYTMGYIPYLGTYPGHHIPQPLHIIQHIGDATPQKICNEILSLTKMNWNTAHFCSGVPITINIARKVSSVIKEVPEGTSIEPSYRYYM